MRWTNLVPWNIAAILAQAWLPEAAEYTSKAEGRSVYCHYGRPCEDDEDDDEDEDEAVQAMAKEQT